MGVELDSCAQWEHAACLFKSDPNMLACVNGPRSMEDSLALFTSDRYGEPPPADKHAAVLAFTDVLGTNDTVAMSKAVTCRIQGEHEISQRQGPQAVFGFQVLQFDREGQPVEPEGTLDDSLIPFGACHVRLKAQTAVGMRRNDARPTPEEAYLACPFEGRPYGVNTVPKSICEDPCREFTPRRLDIHCQVPSRDHLTKAVWNGEVWWLCGGLRVEAKCDEIDGALKGSLEEACRRRELNRGHGAAVRLRTLRPAPGRSACTRILRVLQRVVRPHPI